MYQIAPPGSRIRGKHSLPGCNLGHVKLWTMNQAPWPSCKCFWNYSGTIENTQTPPPVAIPGGPPTNNLGTGGGRMQ